jgi:hypothetical protein
MTGTTKELISDMKSVLSERVIRNLPVSVVDSLSDSITNLMIRGVDLSLSNDLVHLYQASQETLLESLKDSLPGQKAFHTADRNSKIKAQRMTPDE